MEIRNNDGTTNTQTRDNIQQLVFYIDHAGKRTRDLIDDDTMKTSMQVTRRRRPSI